MTLRILVIDNYDSFTYNLVHVLEKFLHAKVDVCKNDQIPFTEIQQYDKIVLSPGPGLPDESGDLMLFLSEWAERMPILGVCLGQQAIGQFFGGELQNLDQVYHGLATSIHVIDQEEILFNGISSEFMAGRYHSWIVSRNNWPACLKITAVDCRGEVMAIRHRSLNICAVQFHPESILTPEGERIIQNWLQSA